MLQAALRFSALFVALTFCGCAAPQADREPPPHLAELPNFPELDHGMPIKVGVEGGQRTPRKILVREYKEIEPTPEEREILGDEPDPGADLLGFYRKQPGPEQGVSPTDNRMRVGQSVSVGGISTGLVSPRAGAGIHTYDLSGAYVGFGPARFGAIPLGVRTPAASSSIPWSVRIGENPDRKPASSYKYSEY